MNPESFGEGVTLVKNWNLGENNQVSFSVVAAVDTSNETLTWGVLIERPRFHPHLETFQS